MKKYLLISALVACTFAVSASNAATNLITDGTFSNSNVPAADSNIPGSGYYYANGYGINDLYTNTLVSDVPWKFVDSSGVINGSSAWGLSTGQEVAFLQSYTGFPSSNPSISQTFTTGASGNYQLTFDIANRWNGGGIESVNVLLNGNQQGPTIQENPVGSFSQITLNLNGLSASTSYTLAFIGVNPTTSDSTVFLDNVSVTAVPEPTEGALLLSGIGLMGFIASRRSRKV